MDKTDDMRKTKAQLIEELQALRSPVAGAEGQGDILHSIPQFFANMLDAIDDPVFVKDEEHRWVLLNDACCDLIGRPREALIGKSDYDISSQQLADVYWERDALVLETGQTDVNEETVMWHGEPRIVATKKSLFVDPATDRRYIVGTIRDISDRVQAERELERYADRLEHRATQLETAAEISRAASGLLDAEELIPQAVALIGERFDLYYAGLFLVDEEEEWAILHAGTGEAGQKMLQENHRLAVGGESMIGWCVANEEARIALDVGQEAVRFDNPHLPETRSELALPLISRGQAIGALTIQSTEATAFGEEDIAVLQTMADQLANAIANARLYDALVREQTLMTAMMENTPDHIYFKDTESRFIRISNSQAERFGLDDPEQAVGKTDFDFFTEAHARPAYEDEQRIMRTGEPMLNVEERETWADRPDTWVSTSKIPLYDQEGNLIGTFGISSDITARKRAQEALERRNVQLRAAADVAREATAILDIEELLNRTVGLISERFGFYHAGIFLVDEPREYAVLRAASSEGGRRMLERGHRLAVGEVGLVGYAADVGEPRIALDVGEDAVFFDNVDLPDTRSEMALPLQAAGRTIGVLDIQSVEPAAFSEEDVAILETMAGQLATAIENARLVERTEAQLRELSMLHGEYDAAMWSALVTDRPLSYMYDRVDVLPVDEPPVPTFDQAMERGQPVALSGEEDVGSVVAVPLKFRDQVIGTMGVQVGDDGREWTADEIALIEDVGAQVAQAIDNARLFAETQRTARSMEALYETSRALSTSLDEESMMQALLETLYQILNCQHILISTVDQDAGTIGVRHGVWQGEFDVFPDWIQMSRYSLDQPDILADVCRTGRTEIIAGWDDRLNREIYEKFGHERFLRVFMPIKLRDRVLGVIEVGYDRNEKGRVSEDELQMLSAFIDQAAVALENVQLFERAQRRAQREHRIYEISTKLRRSPDIATILETAVNELGQALRTDRALVHLRVKPRESQQGPGEDTEEAA